MNIIIPTPEIIQSCLFVIDIATVAERLHSAERTSHTTRLADWAAPCIIHIVDNGSARTVQNSYNVTLQILHIAVRRAIKHHHRRFVLRIVEEVQFITALLHMHNVLVMQRIISHDAIDRFLNPQPIFIIHKAGINVNTLHACKLSVILPGVGSGAVIQ